MTTTFSDGKKATVMKALITGRRDILVEDKGYSYKVPLDIAALAVGKDAWLRKVKIRCEDCKCETEVGSTEIPGLCDECLYVSME
jgi:hypothetical protein